MTFRLKIIAFLIALIVLFLTFAPRLWAQDCPEGYKCLPDDYAKEVADVLDLHNCMLRAAESGDVQLDWQPTHLTVTEDGQVFAKEDLVADLHWCTWHLQFIGKTEIQIHTIERKEPLYGFRLRVRLGIAWLPTRLSTNAMDMIDPVLLVEPFYIRHWHIHAHAGLSQIGLSVGMDLTKNLNTFAGVGLAYKGQEILPVLGISLSFN
jgi:hypothetical protein